MHAYAISDWSSMNAVFVWVGWGCSCIYFGFYVLNSLGFFGESEISLLRLRLPPENIPKKGTFLGYRNL
jgi:hypothetical protein